MQAINSLILTAREFLCSQIYLHINFNSLTMSFTHQMMSGSTPPPPTGPVLQYGGVTPHAPVFAKPYVGVPLKEESKRYAGSVGSVASIRTPFMQS